MHVHYHSAAFVLGGAPVGEANRYVTLFTRDLGLLSAVARSVRAEHSKLRPLLQDFSEVQVTLVRGRDVWRVTGALFERRVSDPLGQEPERIKLAARLGLLLRRLLPGEEKNEPLYAVYETAIDFLERTPKESLTDLEYLSVLRILDALGYRSRLPVFEPLLHSAEIAEPMLALIQKNRPAAVSEINALLEASQL